MDNRVHITESTPDSLQLTVLDKETNRFWLVSLRKGESILIEDNRQLFEARGLCQVDVHDLTAI